MKDTRAVILVLLVFLVNSVNAQNSDTMKNELDSVSYALGMSIANNLKQNGIDSVNSEVLASAVKTVMANQKPDLGQKEANDIINNHIQEKQKAKLKEQTVAGDKFLEENAKKDGVITTESGLQYRVVEMGDGPKPTDGQQVTVHYRGSLIDGTVFDESYKRGQPSSFGVNQVIPGWTEGLKLMPVGSTFEFFIPQELGYGARGAGAAIPPFSTLIFTVELIAVQ
jgi:FKBP-type peptidyl-prolyl cis-trans isomerase FklB